MTFTANMKHFSSLFSCVYSRVKLFVFAMNSRRRCSIFVCFIYGSEVKNSEVNVMLNLSIISHVTYVLERRAHMYNLLE